jgi:hypothetical protein
MPRSNRIALIARAAFTAALFVCLPFSAHAQYHLELEANPAAPFPFLAKFGTVHLHVFRGGVRAETLWLNAFSRDRTDFLTILNPLGRMYVEMPIANIASMLTKLGGTRETVAYAVPLSAPLHGKVKGLDATRYRLAYGPDAWIDLWMIESIPQNAQLRRIVDELVAAISPSTAAAARKIPGTPVYVELNFSHYKKLPLLRMKELRLTNEGEDDALRVGALYMKAPFAAAILK